MPWALVPVQAKPLDGVEQRILSSRHEPLPVGVLDADHKLAAVLARKQPVKEEGAERPDVGQPRRARRNPNAYGRPRHETPSRSARGESAPSPSGRGLG